jgi:serine/threonine protein kinase
MDTWIGQQLGPYELQARLGAGGMGVVYRAVHRRLGQARAIKVLPAMLAYDETFLQRFEREARLASELRHPNIVMIYDIAEERSVNYIVMELLDGRSLHELIRNEGPLPLDRAVGLLQQLADALDFAHRRGVVHRDIKPGNAIVRADDHLTLVDFGIARAAEGTRLTEANTRVGTAEYMAPEAITEGDSGAGTDLYALGIIAYEMLTGRVPFTGVSSQTIMYAQIHTPPPPPRSLRSDLSPAIEEVILRQLDKDPTHRYPTALAFVLALAGAGQVSPDGASSPTRIESPGATPGSAPTARLDRPIVPGTVFASVPPVTGSAEPNAPLDATAVLQPAPNGPRSGSRPAPPGTARNPVPPPPTPPRGSNAAPESSPILRALEESRLGMVTLYKLVIGGVVLLLLLMSVLPTPRDPLQQNFSERLAFPTGTIGGHVLGGDQFGRDVLSRLMVGGRALLFRLAIVGLLLTAGGILLQRRLKKRTGRAWPSPALLVMLVAGGLALSVLSEALIGYAGPAEPARFLGPVGRIFLGVPANPPVPTWGGMLAEGRQIGVQAPWLPIFPLAGLILVMLGIVSLGSGLADVVRQRTRA